MSSTTSAAVLSALGSRAAAIADDMQLAAGVSDEKPTGEFVAEMTSSGAWPESNASEFRERKTRLESQLRELNTALYGWETRGAQIFNGSLVWSGLSASVASAVVTAITQAMKDRQNEIGAAITSCETVATKILATKGLIGQAITQGHTDIETIRNNAAEDEADPTAEVNKTINAVWSANRGSMNNAAVSLGGPVAPPASPPVPEQPDTGPEENIIAVSSTTPAMGTSTDNPDGTALIEPAVLTGGTEAAVATVDQPDEVAATPSIPAPVADQGAPTGMNSTVDAPDSAQAALAPGLAPAVPPLAPGTPPAKVTGGQGTGSSGSTGAPGSSRVPGSLSGSSPAPASPMQDLMSGSESSLANAPADASQAGQTPTNPVEAFLQGYSEAEPSVNPASGGEVPTAAPAQTAPLAPDLMNTSTQPAGPNPSGSSSAAGSAAPVGQPGPSGPMNSGSSMSGGGLGMPLAPPPTVSPSAPPPMAPAPAAPMPPPAAAAGAVPVSAARRERDAIAAAGRRGNDPARVAVRIAAALNAIPTQDFGFYWVTALTVDGTIVVANSYGIGFIPEGVKLPERVKMASADESIPAADRGKWATYPVLSLQGWAEQHSTALRMVIATESQFQGFDPGAAKVVLQPDDIPDHGQMQGRSRLEVIAPAAAAQLATVTDSALPELLPVAPADLTPPPDETFNKWFNVMKPLMSRADERGHVHLQAFVEFANYAQVRAVYAAAPSPPPAPIRVSHSDDAIEL